jgi:hypothetical protein
MDLEYSQLRLRGGPHDGQYWFGGAPKPLWSSPRWEDGECTFDTYCWTLERDRDGTEVYEYVSEDAEDKTSPGNYYLIEEPRRHVS